MILVVAATEIEMKPFLLLAGDQPQCLSCIGGIGPVETSVRLTSFLLHDNLRDKVKVIVNFGVAGAYKRSPLYPSVSLLDLCLARQEILGDLGICYEDHLDMFTDELNVTNRFILNRELMAKSKQILEEEKLVLHLGNFITVNCVSGTGKRGTILAEKYDGLCENMEGAAVARVCQEFSLPMVGLRCISNLVEDRNVSNWKLKEACEKAAYGASLIVKKLRSELEEL